MNGGLYGLPENVTMRPTIQIPVAPVAKPRMTRSDKWKTRPAVLKYRQFKDDLRVNVKGTLEPRFSVIFLVPMPVSWSEKKKAAMYRMPHQQRPDVDNYLKGLMDALCVEDSHVYDVRSQKYWDYNGSIELTEYGEKI